jgi:hypothetical protein
MSAYTQFLEVQDEVREYLDTKKVLTKIAGKRTGKKCKGAYIAADKKCNDHYTNGKLNEKGKSAAQELAGKVRARKGMKPVQSTSQKESDKLPDGVKRNIQNAISTIKNFNKSLDAGRGLDKKFQGEGRYEFDTWKNFGGKAKSAQEVLDKYHGHAPSNGVNFAAVLHELGHEPLQKMSSEAGQWDQQQTKPVSNVIPTPTSKPKPSAISIDDVRTPEQKAAYAKQEAEYQRSHGSG